MSSQQNQEFLINGILTRDRQSYIVANKCNDHWFRINQGHPTGYRNPEDYLEGIHKITFLVSITKDEIRIIIEKLKHFSPGWNGLNSDIIKQTYSSMIEPLRHIIHLSFDKGYVPYELKVAKVVPI